MSENFNISQISDYSHCLQCPRKCGVDRYSNQLGFCKEPAELRIAFAGLHFGEEPLITVRGGSGTIFFTGCTLRCAFCQNYQISQDGLGRNVSTQEFAQICQKLQSAGAENINLVTGSHNIPLITEGIRAAKESGVTIPFCWNSSAYESVESLELLKGLVTIWLPDFKTLDNNLSKSLFSAQDYPQVAKNTIKWMIQNSPLEIQELDENGNLCKDSKKIKYEKMISGVIIRHLALPGRFEDTAEVLAWLKENADSKACISLMNQYTPVPFAEDKNILEKRKKALTVIENRLISKDEDADIQDLIEAYDFDYLFYQELSDDTSWLPDFTRKQPFSNKLAKPLWHCNYQID